LLNPPIANERAQPEHVAARRVLHLNDNGRRAELACVARIFEVVEQFA
jgi:hypothetical protein